MESGIWCNRVYDGNLIKDIRIEGLLESICHNMHSNYYSKKDITVHDLARQTTLLAKLQHGSRNMDVAYRDDSLEDR